MTIQMELNDAGHPDVRTAQMRIASAAQEARDCRDALSQAIRTRCGQVGTDDIQMRLEQKRDLVEHLYGELAVINEALIGML